MNQAAWGLEEIFKGPWRGLKNGLFTGSFPELVAGFWIEAPKAGQNDPVCEQAEVIPSFTVAL